MVVWVVQLIFYNEAYNSLVARECMGGSGNYPWVHLAALIYNSLDRQTWLEMSVCGAVDDCYA